MVLRKKQRDLKGVENMLTDIRATKTEVNTEITEISLE